MCLLTFKEHLARMESAVGLPVRTVFVSRSVLPPDDKGEGQRGEAQLRCRWPFLVVAGWTGSPHVYSAGN